MGLNTRYGGSYCTCVNHWILRGHLKEQYSGQCEHAVLLGQLLIIDLNEFYSSAVRFIVDVLDFRQHSAALFAVVAI